eukprot:903008-Rhodomonas_salina.1
MVTCLLEWSRGMPPHMVTCLPRSVPRCTHTPRPDPSPPSSPAPPSSRLLAQTTHTLAQNLRTR